ncbi:LytR cell envelope-related transcriptional attenuator [Rhodococcus tukisamuensis]|uniref:LytR cell envelope-related transcriptional attenuator n=1 Tax=Rhodococcus tukisamuensis TaxID=168276 RepID=A0A1G6VUP6_9NOCA|nr:LytR cell envelope-related transcriptional attenuator [Rhodococcus tukisamuensis]
MATKVGDVSTPNPEPSGPPLRALAMVLIALAIAFAGIGAMALSGSDSDSPAPTIVPSVAPVKGSANSPAASARPTTPPPATTSAAVTTTSLPTSAATLDRSAVPVRVFNNSIVSGLAAETASTLEAEGWTVSETGNYADGTIAKTTVYYRPGSASEKQAATEIAAEIGATAEPRFAGIESSSPGVIVIVTSK